ncbi:MAG: family 78 glycoside hydrolase catalytic domain [Chitinophagaceae bacterium]|nr:family 78 glycoside hydrolase catalytic domain [Chitinophagaceae bacterium]
MTKLLRLFFIILPVISFAQGGQPATPLVWQAEWVTDSKTSLIEDSLLFGDNPAPLFRKELEVAIGVRKAVLYISGLGYYRATFNGKKVGDHFLDPGWTDYKKTVPYNTFDVTTMLIKGRNCLGVELGNGWYNPLPLRMWGSLAMRKFLPTGAPRFIARLEIEYVGGKRQVEVSDGSWNVTDGPLRRNNNYIGSTYDDRYALPGWDRPGYDDKAWRKALVTSAPGGEMVPQMHPPIRARGLVRPVDVRRLGPDKYLVDMGRNFGGIVRLTAMGRKGTRIQLRYGELLNTDGSLNVMTSVAGQIKRKGAGGPGAPPVAWQQDDLILGERKVVFEPVFTFHGFRYVEIEGYPGVLTRDMIQGIPLSSDVRQAGSFRCSDTLFNRIQEVSLNTFLSNLFSVQSDCPHREKLGYGGDIVATSEAFMANFDMHSFYAKTVRDFVDEAQPDGALTETAPYVGIADKGLTRTAGPIGWGTVLPLLLEQLYQYYGDSDLIVKYYPAARAWVDFLHAHAEGYIIDKGIGDHESLDPKQVEVTSTAFLFYNTLTVSKLARLLGRQEEADRYEKLAGSVKEAFVKKFYDPVTGAVGIHTEATQAFALYFHLLPEEEEKKALKVLLDQIGERKEHVSTGIFGTKYLLEVLSEHGLSDLACKLAGQRDFPGWGNMLAQGATTLWEHWDYSDNIYSHNHPMFGSISGWFYKYIAGIRPAKDAVGYNKIILQPAGFERLSFARAEYQGPRGGIGSSWRKKGDSIYYEAVVPEKTSATVLLPDGVVRHVGPGKYLFRTTFHTASGQEALIPYPLSVVPGEGRFVITRHTGICRVAHEGQFLQEATYLRQMLADYLGPLEPKAETCGENTVTLRLDTTDVKEPEGYAIKVLKDRVILSAREGAGMFYAIQTLRQLMPAEVEKGHGNKLTIDVTQVRDYPRYLWRGMHLDVSRHFFSTDYLKKYIDMMALYKMNKLHLHLTDDQGWRIEIKKYPRLTSEGGWRTFNDQDSACMRMARETDNPDMNIDQKHIRRTGGRVEYGGYYTQEEMKDIIRYAALHYVEIIPEIDMPGHMMAAIALYPELTCDGKKGDDWTKGFSTPICPCRESTLSFARDIYSEIADLFPSKYIHIGGDEVERSHWKASPVCQSFMQEHHIGSVEQLQSYFNDYIQAFFRTKGKTLIGWDEIVEGGINADAVVMFWRPWARTMPAKATAGGNKVIMTPDGPLYFDAIPDRKTLAEVYHYDPTGAQYGMSVEQQKNILGVQANLWSEMVPSEERADYLIMPRMTALAELGWTNRDLYDSYLQRLSGQYDRLDRLHVHYRLPDLAETADSRVFVDPVSFMIQPPAKDMQVRYTVDGSWPSLRSPLLDRPLRIDHPLTLRVAAFTAGGRRGDVSTTLFSRQDYAPPAVVKTDLANGLRCGFYQGGFNRTTDMKGAAERVMIMTEPGLLKEIPATGWGLKFTGYIEVPETGIYSFYLNSDDGSMLHIAGRLVVDNDGMHSPRERVGQVALQKGLHVFALDYIDGGGGGALELRYSKDGGNAQVVPAEWLKHDGSAGM